MLLRRTGMQQNAHLHITASAIHLTTIRNIDIGMTFNPPIMMPISQPIFLDSDFLAAHFFHVEQLYYTFSSRFRLDPYQSVVFGQGALPASECNDFDITNIPFSGKGNTFLSAGSMKASISYLLVSAGMYLKKTTIVNPRFTI